MVYYIKRLRQLYGKGPGGKRAAYGAFLHNNPEYLEKAKEITYPVKKKRKSEKRLKIKPSVQAVLPKNTFDGGMSTVAAYSGKIIKARGKSSLALRNKYQKNGACTVVETYGRVQDVSLVAVGHVSWQLGGMQKAITIALLRKLFKIAGCMPEASGQKLDFFTVSGLSGGGFILSWQLMDSDGTITNNSYTMPLGATFDSIVVNTSLAADISGMWTDANPRRLERIFLWEYFGDPMVATEASGRRMVATVNLKQEILSISCNVITVLQNRTPSSGTPASNSIDVIDAQPVKGPVYTFRGIPKTKTSAVPQLNVANFRGIILFRLADLSPASENLEWAEPPAKNNFCNVKSSSYVRLAPGQLKDMSLSKTWKGSFIDLMAKFRLIREGTDTAFCPGDAQVCYLEEELNSGSSNAIHIQYETQHTIGAVFTTKKTPNMGAFFDSELINLPPIVPP